MNALTGPKSLAELRAPRPTNEELTAIGGTVAKKAGSKIETYIRAREDTLVALLPPGFGLDRFIKGALVALRSNPKLLECSVESITGELIKLADMGLEANTHAGFAFLIPRNGRKLVSDESGKKRWTEVMEAKLQLGYPGRIELAYRSGRIGLIKAVAVYGRDRIEVHEGTRQEIVHEPLLTGDRGSLIGFYSIAKIKGGETVYEWMTVTDGQRIRNANSDAYTSALSRHSTDTPWLTDFVEMGRKTLINRLYKYIPKSREMTLADEAEADLGDVIDADLAPDPKSKPAEADTETEAAEQTDADIQPEPRVTNPPAQVTHDQVVQLDLGEPPPHVLEDVPFQQETAPDRSASPAQARGFGRMR